MPRFTLQPRQWYAMECLFPDAHRHYSPIWIKAVMPQSGLDGRIDLEFYHANYPEGVRDKLYALRTLRRTSAYFLAEAFGPPEPDRRLILLEAITPTWLRAHFPELRITATNPATLAAELDLATARVPR